METYQDRMTYLDNLRIILVTIVVFFHIICMFCYPMTFWWPAVDKTGSSVLYQNLLSLCDIFMMPHLLFISAIFIFYSLKNKSTTEYLKKRFMRLVIPIGVFVFCAGDIVFQILFKRLDVVRPTYLSNFISYFRDLMDYQTVTVMGNGKMPGEVFFHLQHTWFLSFLFAMTVIVVLVSRFFRKKETKQAGVDSPKQIIRKTILLSLILTLVYVAVSITAIIILKRMGVGFASFIRVFGCVQFRIDQFLMLLPLFLFGLYMYKKEWLTRGDIGSWKMWGILSALCIFAYVLIVNTMVISELNKAYGIAGQSVLTSYEVPLPKFSNTCKLGWILHWFLNMPLCIFLLMFFLSFSRTYLNKPNAFTAFCSRHSINVYLLHIIPVYLLQYSFVNLPMAPIVKALTMLVIIIPACLWLSYRLIYPFPGIAIAFFVTLKLVALFAGFEFYSMALYSILALSFTGALVEFARLLMGERTLVQSA